MTAKPTLKMFYSRSKIKE